MNKILFCSFQCCAVVVACVLGVNTTLGASIECEDDDERTGVCQVEFTLYREDCRSRIEIQCSWDGNIFDPEGHGLMCRTIFHVQCTARSARVTAWVDAETEEERKQRLVDTVDNHVMFGVRDAKYMHCDLKDKEGNPVNDELNLEQCEQLDEAYLGLIELVGDSLRKIRPAEDNELNYRVKIRGKWVGFSSKAKTGRIEYYNYREGLIIIDVRELEHNKQLPVHRDRAFVSTHVHERIHLADQMLHGPKRKWSSEDHNDPNGAKDDRVYEQTAWLYPLLGTPSLDWSRGCHPPYKLRGFLAGWGHDMSISNDDFFCRLGEVIRR